MIIALFPSAADKNLKTRKLKHNVIEAVNELIQDISTCHELIAEQAVEHIHQKYVPRYFIRIITHSCKFLVCFS